MKIRVTWRLHIILTLIFDTYSLYERLNSECAANINNRLSVGNTSVILDMTC